MGKGFTVKLAGLCTGGLLLALPVGAQAKTINELVDQQHSVVAQKQQVQSEIDKINKQLKDLTGQISDRQIAIGKMQDEMDQLHKSIKETKDRIKSREALLKDRVTAVYKNGGSSVNVLEVIMGSKDFGDFLNRVVAIHNITDQDQNIINDQKADQKLLEKQQQKLQHDLEDSQQKLKELKSLVDDAQAAQSKREAILDGLSEKEANISSSLKALIAKRDAAKKAAEAAAKKTASTPTTKSVNHTSMNHTSHTNPSYNFAIPQGVSNGTVNDIVAASRKYIGHSKYVWGGGRTASDVANGYFDCSGYVHWAYEQIGINLGGWSTSALQYVGQPVKDGNLQPGDLVFFNTYKTNGHVGIYIGGGQFIGSQDKHGVEIVSMNSSYWKGVFHGYARRVLN